MTDKEDDFSKVDHVSTPEDMAELFRIRRAYAIERAETAEDALEAMTSERDALKAENAALRAQCVEVRPLVWVEVPEGHSYSSEINAIRCKPPQRRMMGYQWVTRGAVNSDRPLIQMDANRINIQDL